MNTEPPKNENAGYSQTVADALKVFFEITGFDPEHGKKRGKEFIKHEACHAIGHGGFTRTLAEEGLVVVYEEAWFGDSYGTSSPVRGAVEPDFEQLYQRTQSRIKEGHGICERALRNIQDQLGLPNSYKDKIGQNTGGRLPRIVFDDGLTEEEITSLEKAASGMDPNDPLRIKIEQELFSYQSPQEITMEDVVWAYADAMAKDNLHRKKTGKFLFEVDHGDWPNIRLANIGTKIIDNKTIDSAELQEERSNWLAVHADHIAQYLPAKEPAAVRPGATPLDGKTRPWELRTAALA